MIEFRCQIVYRSWIIFSVKSASVYKLQWPRLLPRRARPLLVNKETMFQSQPSLPDCHFTKCVYHQVHLQGSAGLKLRFSPTLPQIASLPFWRNLVYSGNVECRSRRVSRASRGVQDRQAQVDVVRLSPRRSVGVTAAPVSLPGVTLSYARNAGRG